MARSRTLLARFHASSHSFARPAIGLLAAISLMGLAGCESGTQEPDAPAAEAVEFGAAPTPGGSEAPAAESTESAAAPAPPSGESIALPEGAERAIPANFPSSLPIYPGATPQIGMGGEVNGGQRSGVQLDSNDSPADVLAFYESNLPQEGWEIADSGDLGIGQSITASNGSTTMVLFVQERPDGGSTVMLLSEDGV